MYYIKMTIIRDVHHNALHYVMYIRQYFTNYLEDSLIKQVSKCETQYCG